MNIRKSGHIGYHYCSLATFLSILSSGRIWLTDLSKMNDPEELEWARHGMMEALCSDFFPDKSALDFGRMALDAGESERPSLFASCFSRSGDSLIQWRSYADGGQGVALGFDLYAFPKEDDPFLSEIKVKYIDRNSNEGRLGFRHLAWEYINEVRAGIVGFLAPYPWQDFDVPGNQSHLVSYGNSDAEILLSYIQNCYKIADRLASVLRGKYPDEYISSARIMKLIGPCTPPLSESSPEEITSCICKDLRVPYDSRVEQLLSKLWPGIGKLYSDDYFPEEALMRLGPAYSELLRSGSSQMDDAQGSCAACFAASTGGWEELSHIAESHPESFEDSLAIADPRFIASLKHPAYSLEEESRLVLKADSLFRSIDKKADDSRYEHSYYADGDDAKEYYALKFPVSSLRKVVIGPKCRLDPADALVLLRNHGYEKIGRHDIIKSTIPMR